MKNRKNYEDNDTEETSSMDTSLHSLSSEEEDELPYGIYGFSSDDDDTEEPSDYYRDDDED